METDNHISTQVNNIETEHSVNNVNELFFNNKSGFGFGVGAISRLKQLKSGELHTTYENIALDFITTNPCAFVSIDKLDDGCSDGRIAVLALQMQADGTIEHSESLLHRAKVFGGGTMMTVAGKIGVGVIAPSIDAQFNNGINFLVAKNFKFGAHDDDHAEGVNCGCGAIDRYPEHIKNTQLFKTEIKNTLTTLFGEVFDEQVYDEVQEHFRQVLAITAPDEKFYSGKRIRNAIARTGAVIKRLTGRHQEDFIVINFIDNTTLNQSELMKVTNNNVQAFCLDAWRLEAYAKLISDGDTALEQRALYGMLIYTLATSATLTDGTQRVLIRR